MKWNNKAWFDNLSVSDLKTLKEKWYDAIEDTSNYGWEKEIRILNKDSIIK